MSRSKYIGCRYGMLTVTERAGGQNFICKCDCGNEIVARIDALTSGKIKSCGCDLCAPFLQSKPNKLYTILDLRDRHFVAVGLPAKKAAQMMGISIDSFHSIVSKNMSGILKTYEIEITSTQEFYSA